MWQIDPISVIVYPIAVLLPSMKEKIFSSSLLLLLQCAQRVCLLLFSAFPSPQETVIAFLIREFHLVKTIRWMRHFKWNLIKNLQSVMRRENKESQKCRFIAFLQPIRNKESTECFVIFDIVTGVCLSHVTQTHICYFFSVPLGDLRLLYLVR